MRNIPKYETIDDINIAIENLNESAGMLKYIGKYSDHAQQARFEQFITTTEETIRSLTKIKENL